MTTKFNIFPIQQSLATSAGNPDGNADTSVPEQTARHYSGEFLKRFPGPYAYYEGVEGVDLTFDIFCLTNEQRIIASYYWEDRERAELEAQVITAALNHIAGDGLLPFDLSTSVWTTFCHAYPAPYAADQDFREYFGTTHTIHEVISLPRSVAICQSFDSCSEAERVVKHIAAALNHLDAAFASPQ